MLADMKYSLIDNILILYLYCLKKILQYRYYTNCCKIPTGNLNNSFISEVPREYAEGTMILK